MTISAAGTGVPGSSRIFPLVLLLFAASGCAALIYEVVWYQLLQLVIGSTVISLGFLLATFMGGLCLGSFFLPRLVDESVHPLRLYALIELGIGLLGLVVLYGLPLADNVYVAGVQSGMPGMLLRGVICAAVLLAPTFLMGASLPAITRFIRTSPRGITWWGWLYAGNTLGAVLGCLAAAFVLLRLYDMATATYVAVAINFLVAIGSYFAATSAPVSSDASEAETSAVPGDGQSLWPVYLTIAVSGATALGAEVVWTRLLGMMFGATVYCFSIILAVFLVGLAAGSSLGSIALKFIRPRTALAWCQLLLAAGIAWSVFMIDNVLPYLPELRSLNPWEVAFGDLTRALMAMLPPTLLWGASFPLAMAAAAQSGRDPARPVGAVYAANTFGAIIGALGSSLILIAWIGTQNTQRVMLVMAALSGLILLLPQLKRTRSPALGAGLAASLAIAAALAYTLPNQPGELVAYGRMLPSYRGYSDVIDLVEGRNSSIAITQFNDGALQISVNGHVEASNEIYDMRLQRMVGHLPALLHPNPKKILGIGFGAGVSAGSFTRYPSVESITVCEIEPMVPPTSAKHFGRYNNNVKDDPRTTIVYDDARHFMLTTTETYDIIASDPLDVWVKGTASIYSLDYFEKVKQHLNPGGYFSLYVPLYESDEDTVRSELATFFKAFPNGTVWANTIDGRGYDLVLMGQADPLNIDLDVIDQRLAQPDYAPVRVSMQEIGFNSAGDLFSTYAGQLSDLSEWLKGAAINTDADLRLMYLAGWGFNAQLTDPLYRKIISQRKQPDNLFSGPEQKRQAVFWQIQQGIPETD